MPTTDSSTDLPDATLASSVQASAALPDATLTSPVPAGAALPDATVTSSVQARAALPDATVTSSVQASAAPPNAVLWDMDGTLVDTEPLWAEALAATVLASGGTWTDARASAALGASTSATLLLVREALPGGPVPTRFFDEVEARVLSGLEHGIPVQPGARELLDAFLGRRIPQALVTSSNGRVAGRVLRVLGPHHFQAVVTDDLPIPSKPDPAPYVLAARLLEVRTRDCLVFEDSHPGLTAARACGARVWDVTAAPLTTYVLP